MPVSAPVACWCSSSPSATPALLGSPNDQMVSYFVAFYTNTSINWGMATALGGLLLLATVVLYLIYSWLVGASRLRLS